jgi:glycogen operon protein
MYEKMNRELEKSINFVTCHDGFTLNDLVSYNKKRNLANGENNRDGHNDNLSWNCGVEGPTDNPKVLGLRKRQIKNFLASNMLALGAPMLLMGDEICLTQQGNNNAYCQDNELTWFDWDLVEKNADIFRFVKILIKKRLLRETSKATFNMSLRELLGQSLIFWHGTKLNQPDWSEHSRSIALTVLALSRKFATHYLINSYDRELLFQLPESIESKPVAWKRWIDTNLESPEDICLWADTKPYNGYSYNVAPHSMVVLITGLKENGAIGQ